MAGEGLLGAAVANNALWCDAVCRAHGFPGVFGARLWVSTHHELTFYPNVITLRPDVTARETALARTSARGWAVTGISNLFGAGLAAGPLWASALQAVAAFRPQQPIVGYEHGTDLAAARQAGCQALGPLRVWARRPAP